MNYRFPFEIVRDLLPAQVKAEIRDRAGAASLRTTLARLKKAGFEPPVAIDVGAFDAGWARRSGPRPPFCCSSQTPVDQAIWQVDLVFVRNELLFGNRSLGYE